jgi:hypothetical protein
MFQADDKKEQQLQALSNTGEVHFSNDVIA